MHRSGTSMLASHLQARGVAIGDHLIGAAKGNLRGHFEDEAIFDFHLKALARYRDHAWRLFDDGTLGLRTFTYEPTSDELKEAQDIIASHRKSGLWGWKEPRTCLFIDFWQKLLPDMKGIIIYRHPLEVHLSHLRRGANLDLVLRPAQAIHAYTLYNAKLIEQIRQNPSRYLILNANAAFAQTGKLDAELDRFLGLPTPASTATNFHPEEFRSLPLNKTLHETFATCFPEAAAQFDQLQSLAQIKQELTDTSSSQDIKALQTILNALPPEQRAAALPLLEVLTAGEEAPLVPQWRHAIAAAIVSKHTEYNEWAVSSIEEQEGYIRHQTDTLKKVQEEKDKLGEAIQSEIDRTRQIWDELVKVGQDWHHKVNHIEGLTKQIDSLKAEINQLKMART